jgi:hypothetical protein
MNQNIFLTLNSFSNMKQFFTLVLSLSTFLSFGQLTTSFNYSLSLPQGDMAKNITAIHQGVLSVGYRLPKAMKFVQVGADLGYGSYANLSVPVELQFDNSRPTRTNINYNSNVFAANAFLQVDLVKNKIITPYLLLKGGVQNFHSSIVVDDPHDTDGCQPLEKENILSDQTMTYSYGGGFRYQLPTPQFSRCVHDHYINVQFLATQGGAVDYINTKKLTDHSQHTAHQTQQTADETGKPLEMRFINVTSNVVHAHKVAEVYTSTLRLLNINVGYYIRF